MTFSDVAVDDVRRFWNRRPCNIRHSDAAIGTREYFDEVEAKKYAVEPHIPGFARFERWAGKWVLEIGCGIGTDTINFARAGAEVVAVDLSDESLRLVKQRARVYGRQDHIHAMQADAEHLSAAFPDSGWADLIYSFGVIHHSPHPERILAEARKLIAPAGELRVMVYHRRSTKVAALIARHPLRALRGIDRAVAIQSEAQTGCPITYTYSRRQAREFVEAAGFVVENIFVDHIFPWAISPYREHRFERRWYWRPVPARAFRVLERRLGWHLCIVAKPGER